MSTDENLPDMLAGLRGAFVAMGEQIDALARHYESGSETVPTSGPEPVPTRAVPEWKRREDELRDNAPNRCPAVTARGNRCRNYAKTAGAWCGGHANQSERRARKTEIERQARRAAA